MSEEERERKGSREEAIGRLDRWLWFARLVKSRSLAARLIAAGAVALNGGSVRKPGHRIRIGDEIALRAGGQRRSLRVLGLGTRRGPAAEARALYEDAAAPGPLTRLAADWAHALGEVSEKAAFPRRHGAAGTGNDARCENESIWYEPRSSASNFSRARPATSSPRSLPP